MDDPDPIEINQQMTERPLLVVCLEKRSVPIYPLELWVTLRWGQVDEPRLKYMRSKRIACDNLTHLVHEDNPGDTLRVPKELVDIIITNDVSVVSFPPDEATIHHFVPLVANEAVQRLDYRPQVQAFGNGLDSSLTLGGTVIVVCTLEDEAQALGHESDLRGFAPDEEVQSNLAQTIVLGHVVHCLSPAIHGHLQTLLVCVAVFPFRGLEPLQARILDVTDCVIEIQLGGEVPFSVICVFAAYVVCMQGQQGLVR